MKIIYRSLFVGLLLFVLASCSSQNTDIQKPLQRQWMMVSFNGFTKEQLMSKKAEINITSSTDTKEVVLNASAFMGCNRMNGSVKVESNNRLKFNDMIMTQMACDDMKLEDEFVKKLPAVNHYKIEGHFLTLYKDQEELMKFVAADWD